MRQSFNLAKKSTTVSNDCKKCEPPSPSKLHHLSNTSPFFPLNHSSRALYSGRVAVTLWPVAHQCNLACSSKHHLACLQLWRRLSLPMICRYNGLPISKRSLVPIMYTPSVPFKRTTCLRLTLIWITVVGKRLKSCQTVRLTSTLRMPRFTIQLSASRGAKPTALSTIRSSCSVQMRTSAAWTRVTCSWVFQLSTDLKCWNAVGN